MGGEATRSTRRSQGSSGPAEAVAAALESSLGAELVGARWFQGKGGERPALRLIDHLVVPGSGGGVLAIVGAASAYRSEQEYAVPVRLEASGAARGATVADPLWPALARLAVEGGSIAGDGGIVDGVPGSPLEVPFEGGSCRQLEADQSNTSVVLDGRIVLKCYRRLWTGRHPEQELLRGLSGVGSQRAPDLLGTLRYEQDGVARALATAYAYVDAEPVGWESAIAGLTTALGGSTSELEALAVATGELGECAGELHRDLLRAFGSRPATHADGSSAVARAMRGLDEAIAAVCRLAPELEALAPTARREVAGLHRLEGTQLQRMHGDLHVGQLLRGRRGVIAIDFEGDPTLPTDARSHQSSPLVDVASLLLSLDHVAAAASRRLGFGDSTARALAWSSLARENALAAYAGAAPGGATPDPALLRALEIEKEWREALYAARVLPEWLHAPRLVLRKLLA